MIPVALWNWRTEPVPAAKLVVCWPGFCADLRFAEASRVEEQIADCRGMFVAPDHRWNGGTAGSQIIPALHIERQSDLSRLPDLLAVRAQRRTLVVSPKEKIDLGEIERVNPMLWDRLSGVIDLLIITGFDDPISPDNVRDLVRQAREAGVPCVLLWGRWVPFAHAHDDDRALPWTMIGDIPYAVGTSRSGSMLDGKVVSDEIEWLQ